MNIRKDNILELIAENFSTIDIKSDDLVIIKLPKGLKPETSQLIGQSVSDALLALNKHNPVILLPTEIDISTLDEEGMRDLGWIKDATAPKRNTVNSRRRKPKACGDLVTDIDEARKVWKREVTELAGKLMSSADHKAMYDSKYQLDPSIF